MRLATVREFRNHVAHFISRSDPVLVTRHGKVKGLYLPIQQAESLPLDIRKELLAQFGRYISSVLKKAGATEKEILEDFRAFRKHRRGR